MQAAWDIKELESPYRSIVDNELSDILIHPMCDTASHGRLNVVSQTDSVKIEMPPEYWLSRQENNLVLKQIVDYINESYNPIRTQVKLDINGIVHIVVTQPEQIADIVFVEQFPCSSPIVYETDNEGNRCEVTDLMGAWQYTEDIYTSVTEFLNSRYYDRLKKTTTGEGCTSEVSSF